jgi:hypothetical protein
MPSVDQEMIVAEFINQLPRELHDQVIEYIRHRVHELEQWSRHRNARIAPINPISTKIK